MSYGLIRRYGGTLTVDSDEGQGATFTVWLLEQPEMVDDDTELLSQLIHAEADEGRQRSQG